jgi:hypothetical protein
MIRKGILCVCVELEVCVVAAVQGFDLISRIVLVVVSKVDNFLSRNNGQSYYRCQSGECEYKSMSSTVLCRYIVYRTEAKLSVDWSTQTVHCTIIANSRAPCDSIHPTFPFKEWHPSTYLWSQHSYTYSCGTSQSHTFCIIFCMFTLPQLSRHTTAHRIPPADLFSTPSYSAKAELQISALQVEIIAFRAETDALRAETNALRAETNALRVDNILLHAEMMDLHDQLAGIQGDDQV